MAEPKPWINPVDFMRQIDKDVGDGLHQIRKAVTTNGPLDAETCELIIIAAMASMVYEIPCRNHIKRSKEMGIAKAKVQQAVLVTFPATTTMNEAIKALRWIDEIYD